MAGERGEGETSLVRLAVRLRLVGVVDHRPALQLAGEEDGGRARIHPRLLPALAGRVPGVPALALAGALPVLEHHAVAEDALDAALAHAVSGPVVDVPAAHPEVELPPR